MEGVNSMGAAILEAPSGSQLAVVIHGAPATEPADETPPPIRSSRIGQADHVDLVAAQGRKLTAEQAFLAAQAAAEIAHLRVQLARHDLDVAESHRAQVAQRVRDTYQVNDADKITPDGTIWRADA
jgi:hypothetical protein